MQNYLDVFAALKREHAETLQTQHGLMIKTGEGMGAAILKLLKPAWTTDGPKEILNTNGLFFSVWVDAECEAKGIVRYNVHAKKLRFIKGEKFAAREFVRNFRNTAKDQMANWPNCTFPKGPITLFQGHIPLRADTLHSDTAKLIDRFAALTPMLDRLLAA
jgi:hypothetical protein